MFGESEIVFPYFETCLILPLGELVWRTVSLSSISQLLQAWLCESEPGTVAIFGFELFLIWLSLLRSHCGQPLMSSWTASPRSLDVFVSLSRKHWVSCLLSGVHERCGFHTASVLVETVMLGCCSQPREDTPLAALSLWWALTAEVRLLPDIAHLLPCCLPSLGTTGVGDLSGSYPR